MLLERPPAGREMDERNLATEDDGIEHGLDELDGLFYGMDILMADYCRLGLLSCPSRCWVEHSLQGESVVADLQSATIE